MQKRNILRDYQVKYGIIKNEIEGKLSYMIEMFLNDLMKFFENIEVIVNDSEKMKELDRNKKEIKLLYDKITDKTKNEKKLKSEIDSLQQELNFTKKELQFHKDKVFNNINDFNQNDNSTSLNYKRNLHTPSPSSGNLSRLQFKDGSKSSNTSHNIVFTHCHNLTSFTQACNIVYNTPNKKESSTKRKTKKLASNKKMVKYNEHSLIYGDNIPSSSKSLSSHLNVICSNISQKKVNSKDASVMNYLNQNKGKYSRSFVNNTNNISKLKNNMVIKHSKVGCLLENEIGIFHTERNGNFSKNNYNNSNKEVESLLKEYDNMLKCEIDMLDNEAKVIENFLSERNELTKKK